MSMPNRNDSTPGEQLTQLTAIQYTGPQKRPYSAANLCRTTCNRNLHLLFSSGKSPYEWTSAQDVGLRAVGRTFRDILTASYPGPCTGHFNVIFQGKAVFSVCSQISRLFWQGDTNFDERLFIFTGITESNSC
jgi:hypothetical protein